MIEKESEKYYESENDELMIAGSELPVLDEKGHYKYLDEVSGNGAYFQVAWLKVKGKGFVSLYGTEAIKLTDNLNSLEDVFLMNNLIIMSY